MDGKVSKLLLCFCADSALVGASAVAEEGATALAASPGSDGRTPRRTDDED